MCTNMLHYIDNALNCPLSGKQRILSTCTEGNVALPERKWYRKRERAVESTVEKTVAAPRSYCSIVWVFVHFLLSVLQHFSEVNLLLLSSFEKLQPRWFIILPRKSYRPPHPPTPMS